MGAPPDPASPCDVLGCVSWIKTKPTIDPSGMAALGETRRDLNVRNRTKRVGPIDPVRPAAFRGPCFRKRHSPAPPPITDILGGRLARLSLGGRDSISNLPRMPL